MEYMDDDLRSRMQHNNNVLDNEKREAECQEEQVAKLQGALKKLKEIVKPSPTKLAAKAITNATGHSPTYFVAEGIQVIHRRAREHRGLHRIGDRLFGAPSQTGSGLSGIVRSNIFILSGIGYLVYLSLRRK